MTHHLLSDDQIASLSADERRELINRLQRPLDDLLPRTASPGRVRLARLGLMVGGAAALIPWIVFLGFTLPASYVANNWSAVWIGFDIMLLALMTATAVLGFLRRQVLVLTAFATGILLVCDAWFDIMTAEPADRWVSVLTALFAELPLAALLIVSTMRIMRLGAVRMWLLEPHAPLWQLPVSTP